jgi:hypothetical protein
MPVNKNGRYIPTDETDERVQQIIENRPDLIWMAEHDPDEPDYFLITEEIGVLDTVGLYDDHIEERANRIVDRHNKAIRKAMRAALESIQPLLTSTQAEHSGNGNGKMPKDWLDNRPVVLVNLRDFATLGELFHLAKGEEDRTEYDALTEIIRRGYRWAREIEYKGNQYAVFVHPIVGETMGLPG